MIMDSLLKRYMKHVCACEGVTFVKDLELSWNGLEFTQKEIDYLKELDKDI